MKESYSDLIVYLKATIALLEGLDKPDTKEDEKKFKIAVLNDIQKSFERLIHKLS